MTLRYGFEFGTPYSFNSTVLEIRSQPTQRCKVEIYLPIDVWLPKFVFKISGFQDNIIISDVNLNYSQLNFS